MKASSESCGGWQCPRAVPLVLVPGPVSAVPRTGAEPFPRWENRWSCSPLWGVPGSAAPSALLVPKHPHRCQAIARCLQDHWKVLLARPDGEDSAVHEDRGSLPL